MPKVQRPTFDDIEKMEQDEEGMKKHQDMAKKEFAKRKESFKNAPVAMEKSAALTQ